MKIDSVILKFAFIIGLQQLVGILKQNYQRWAIRNISETEISLRRFFDPVFLGSLSWYQIVLVLGIAVFTFATFPLGVWLGSFKMGTSYPAMNMITGLVNIATFPFALYTMSRVLGELELNRTTLGGVFVIVAGKLLTVAGCYLMYEGNN